MTDWPVAALLGRFQCRIPEQQIEELNKYLGTLKSSMCKFDFTECQLAECILLSCELPKNEFAAIW